MITAPRITKIHNRVTMNAQEINRRLIYSLSQRNPQILYSLPFFKRILYPLFLKVRRDPFRISQKISYPLDFYRKFSHPLKKLSDRLSGYPLSDIIE